MSTLFEKFYNATDQEKAAAELPQVRRKLKLRFHSANVSLLEKESILIAEHNSVSEKVECLDINRLLEIQDELAMLSKDKEAIKVLYKEWFGSEMQNIDEEE